MQPKENISEESSETDLPELFEGTDALNECWWISRCFFTWITPLVRFTNKYDALKLKSLGNVPPQF